MIHPIRAWNAFFFRPVSARPLGAIRIAFGLLALINLGLCAVDLDHWYTDAGLLRGDEARVIATAFQPSPLQYYQGPAAARVAFAFTATAAALLTIGWHSRVMSVLFYLGMLAIHNRNLVTSSGADVLLMTFAFNLMFCPTGAAYSLDARREARRRGTPAEPLILPWGLRLIQIQISLVYALAAFLKAGGSAWVDGTALHYVLNNSEVRRLDVSVLTHYPILINLMTYGALAVEFSLAILIWFRATRPLVLCLGILLHLGIAVTINIPIFGELMWVGYLAFLTPPEFDALLRAVDPRRWFAIDRPDDVAFSVLIPNERGLENALAARDRFHEISVFLSASETHNHKNVNRSVEESMSGLERVLATATAEGLRCEGVIATSFGCPYEGHVDPERVLELAGRLAAAGCSEVGFGDTTGMANPRQVGDFYELARTELNDVELTAHFHNTRGQGLANVLAALEQGIDSFESSFGELGGCPVPAGSTGNVSSEDVVSMLHEMGVETGIDLELLLLASRAAQEVLGRPLGAHLLTAGPVDWHEG